MTSVQYKNKQLQDTTINKTVVEMNVDWFDFQDVKKLNTDL